MTWILVLVVFFLLALLSWLSAVGSAVLTVSRSALETKLTAQGRADRAEWLVDHERHVVQAVALARIVLSLGIVGAMLVAFMGVGEQATLRWGAMIAAGASAGLLIWLGSSVLASALARHASVTLVSTGLGMLRGLDVLLSPLTRGLAFVDEAVRRLTGANLVERDDAVEAELLRSIGDTQREGGLDATAAALMENVVEFSNTDVGEVMTPRTDIDGIEYTDDIAVIRSFIDEAGHSRIPVYEENLDHIVGVLYVKDLVPYLGEDASGFVLRPILRQPIVVPETKPVGELLADFQRGEVHMAMVIDEYGGTAGLVTIEDVLEEIVGEIQDEHDPDHPDEPSLARIDEHRAEVDGRYHIDDLNEQLGLQLPEDDEFDTIAGYLLWRLGHVPTVGETLEADGVRFTAIAATPTHIQRIGLEVIGDDAAEEAMRTAG